MISFLIKIETPVIIPVEVECGWEISLKSNNENEKNISF